MTGAKRSLYAGTMLVGWFVLGAGVLCAAETAGPQTDTEVAVQEETPAPQAEGSPLTLRVEPRHSNSPVLTDPTTRPVLPMAPVRQTPVGVRELKMVIVPRPALEQGPLILAQDTARNERARQRPRLRTGRRLAIEPSLLPNPLLRLPMVVRPQPEPVAVTGEAALDLLGRPVLPPYEAFRRTPVSVQSELPPDPLVNPNAIFLAQTLADDEAPARAPVYLPRPALPASVPGPQ